MIAPKVSVIMPSLNVEPYIRECIESVMNQTLKEIEIICVDAGSTDGTLEILREYAAEDSRIRIIISEKKSYGYQMNIGIDAAHGEYIGVVETDDYIEPDMYAELYRIAKSNSLDLVKADFRRFVDEEGIRRFSKWKIADLKQYGIVMDPSSTIDFFMTGRSVLTWAGIYSAEFLREYSVRHNETPGASFQDNGFWFQVFTQAKRAMFINKSFYNLRRDNPNSSTQSKEKVFCICEEYDFIRGFLGCHPDLEERFAAVCAYRRMCNYDFTLNRIASEYKLEFLRRYAADFRKIKENGELDRSLYTANQWIRLNDIMESPEYAFYHEYFKPERNKEQALDSSLKNELDMIRKSRSYKIGRVITWLPRKIQGGIRCLKEHGWRYTWNRFLVHFHLRKEN